MYPNLNALLNDLFGIDWQWTKIFNSFGLMLALSFLAAAWVLLKEFQRKRRQGLFEAIEETEVYGEPVKPLDWIVQFVVGFLIGYKIVGGIVSGKMMEDAQSYIGTKEGSWPLGLLVGGLLVALKWYEKQREKKQYPTTTKKIVQKYPEHRVGDFTILAAVSGILGAKLFSFFENWDSFVQDPISNIVSPQGLTFYGGLIVAAVVLIWYAKNKKINWKHLTDAVAPGLMIAYAVGRLGCQISGDGDWGIYNSAYASTLEGKVVVADSTYNLQNAIRKDDSLPRVNQYAHFASIKKEFGTVPHKSVKAPWGLPTWTVAMNYAHNVNEDGWTMKGSNGKKYNTVLPNPVFPTPLYEFLMCSVLFLILWALRKKITTPGVIFGLYLMMNGAERFLIEKIRVNTTINLFGLKPSQAEIISTLLFIGGLIVIWYCNKTKNDTIK
jgi:prolipoprotein diacylglyceryltransferase